MVFTARRRLDDLAGAVYETVFYDAMDAILNKGLWRSYVHDVTGKTLTFESMDEFLTSDDGLGIQDLGLFRRCMEAVATSPGAIAASAKNLLKRLKEEAGMTAALPEIAELPAHGEIGGGHTRVDNVKSAEGGNSQAYLLRRLQRDNPELVEQVKAGEIRSVRAAAIKAGIVKDVPTVRMVEPTKAAQAIVQRAGLDFAQALAIELADLVKTT
jgi:hypothetical protein